MIRRMTMTITKITIRKPINTKRAMNRNKTNKKRTKNRNKTTKSLELSQ